VDAAALARRLVIMEKGRITQDAPVRDVFHAPSSPFTATVAGVNRVVGTARGGLWAAADRPVLIATADAASRSALSRDGAVVAAVFAPSAVRVTGAEESREDRATPGTWNARVERLEQTPGGVRVHTADPRVAADLTPDAVAALSLRPGLAVALSVAAQDVRINAVP
jgi:molybdate transport system ATP-binding protein